MGVLGVERVLRHAEATVTRWLLRAAEHVERLLDWLLRGIRAAFMQLDELKTWFFCKVNELWVWCSFDCVTKLWLALHVSRSRSKDECRKFLRKTAKTLAEPPQGASTDGLLQYTKAVPARWKTTPYAQVVKHYEDRRLVCVEHKQVTKATVADVEFVLAKLGLGAVLNTAFIERLNATTRAGPARFHRRTLKYSKDEKAATAALVLRQAAYNFVRLQGRRQNGRHDVPQTPAMKAGIATAPWTWLDLLTRKPTI